MTGFSKNADVAKLADAQVSGSCGQPCGFESLHPHHAGAPLVGAFLLGADEGNVSETAELEIGEIKHKPPQ